MNANKVAIVTGANTGIGFEATKILCKSGYDIILACRNEENGQAAISKLLKGNPAAKLSFEKLDLASLKSIHDFAERFHDRKRPLHLLINNAGFTFAPNHGARQLTEDGFELTMGTNHLGHFLLTQLLLPDLEATARSEGEARIVVVASRLHDTTIASRSMRMAIYDPDLNDLMLTKPGSYNGAQAYSNSKAANIMFTQELARRLVGTGVTANCLCPGFIPATGLMRNVSRGLQFFCRNVLPLSRAFTKNVTRTPLEGGTSICMLAKDPSLKGVSGKYYMDDKEILPTSATIDPLRQQALWDMSSRLVQLQPHSESPPTYTEN